MTTITYSSISLSQTVSVLSEVITKILTLLSSVNYVIRDIAGMTDAARTEQELAKLTMRDLNDIGIAPYQISDIVAEMRRKRL